MAGRSRRGRRGPRSQLHGRPGLHGVPGGGRGELGADEFGADELDADESLLDDVREALRASHPLPLLSWASSLLTVVDPRLTGPFDRPSTDDGPSREGLIASFIDVRRPETTALLEVIAALSDDELEQRRIRRELADRAGKPPRWLRRLLPITVRRTVEMSHVLGDGDNLMLDVVTGNGDPMTVVVYIDHNMGTLVKDAFVIDEPLAALEPEFKRASDGDPDTIFTELDPADARARITDAIDLAAMTWPPLETETWPGCRPLVEWVVRHLPEGGTGYVRPAWSDEAREALVERFIASPYAPDPADIDEDDVRDLADVMVWFACDYGPGDPLRWSQVAVEIFLTDFLARKVLFSPATLQHGPEVLAAFVRFAHADRDIRSSLTTDTLEAVHWHTPEFLAHLEGSAGIDADQIAQLLGEGGLGGFLFDDDGRPVSFEDAMTQWLVDRVGSEQALEDLDTIPLPDEPLDLDQLPEDIRERVAGIAAMADGCCEELLDTEHRTACRRLLADVAAADPAIFRRRASDERAAAAVAWVITKANDTLEPYHGGLTATALLECFGVSGSVSQRAGTMLQAIGVPPQPDSDIRLGSPRYLVAAARAAIIARRDRDA